MATALRPIDHEDRLSLVEHLDELRTRLVICVVALAVAFGICAWQNGPLLHIVNRPLENAHISSKDAAGRLDQAGRTQLELRRALQRGGTALERIARSRALGVSDRAAVLRDIAAYNAAVKALPTKAPARQPVTLGLGEPLSSTLTVSAYFALLLTLPLILYQAYAFVLPAFSPREKRIALPLMAMVPFLFIIGVLFGYFVVLPPAIKFLQGFNSSSFDVLVQAKQYYSFIALTLIALGLVFQLPVGILALTRLGIVSIATLRKQRRYAIVACAVVAMLLPGTDPVTTLIEMVPLVALYELSILLSAALDRGSKRRDEAEAAAAAEEEESSSDPVGSPLDAIHTSDED